MTIDMKTVQAMLEAGIFFEAQIRQPGGAETISLEAGDIGAYIADRDQFAADMYRVPKATYVEWIQHDGTPRCSGLTTKGEPCRNYMSGYSQLPLSEWMRRDGGYCKVHGGDGSKEARDKGFGTSGFGVYSHMLNKAEQSKD